MYNTRQGNLKLYHAARSGDYSNIYKLVDKKDHPYVKQVGDNLLRYLSGDFTGVDPKDLPIAKINIEEVRQGLQEEARAFNQGGQVTNPNEEEETEDPGFGYRTDIIPRFQEAVSQPLLPVRSDVAQIPDAPGTTIDPSAGQAVATPVTTAAQVEQVAASDPQQPITAETYTSALVSPQVQQETQQIQAAQGQVSEGAQIQAAQGQISPQGLAPTVNVQEDYIDQVISGDRQVTENELAQAQGLDRQAVQAQIAQAEVPENISIAQGTVTQESVPDAAQINESNIAQAEVLTNQGLTPDARATAANLDRFNVDTETVAQFRQGNIEAQDTVQGQLEILMRSFDDGTPAWARGAINAANAAMYARGMGRSSAAGAAILRAAMETALPIAQADAQAFRQMKLDNLSRQQQISLTNAAAQQGVDIANFNAEQQVALQNSSAAARFQELTLTNGQQTILANAQIRASLQGQNLSNQQQSNLVTAARYAEVSNINLTNRQQGALQDSANNLQIDLANLSSQQQAYISNAQIAQALQGKQIDNQQAIAITNAARFAEANNLTFTTAQQSKLHNSNLMQTIGLANLNSTQASVLQNAAAVASMDAANLQNRQQQAVQNAQTFLNVDMTNLANRQQIDLFRGQQNVQSRFSDQAAVNAAAQFNATNQNQVDQYFAGLAQANNQYNATQINALNQVNVNAENAIRQFNSSQAAQRNQFNAQNSLLIAQANAAWRQALNTTNTAAQNEANMSYAKQINELTGNNIDAIWQRERDLMEYNYNAHEEAKDRGLQLLLGDNEMEIFRQRMQFSEDASRDNVFFRFLFEPFKGYFGGGD